MSRLVRMTARSRCKGCGVRVSGHYCSSACEEKHTGRRPVPSIARCGACGGVMALFGKRGGCQC
jgi:hypothetical protein